MYLKKIDIGVILPQQLRNTWTNVCI